MHTAFHLLTIESRHQIQELVNGGLRMDPTNGNNKSWTIVVKLQQNGIHIMDSMVIQCQIDLIGSWWIIWNLWLEISNGSQTVTLAGNSVKNMSK